MSVEVEVPVEREFAAYVAARGAALQRFAFLVTGSAADAPDLVQDALLHAWPRWGSLVQRGTAEAYLRRSIVNGSIDLWRRSGRTTAVADPESLLPIIEPGPDADDADRAWALCATLPPVQRAAVVLRFHEDQAFAAIAAALGCTESTARSHVHRAVRALRMQLEASDD